MVICILDTGCDLTHPDLQFSTPGVHLDDMKPDGSPIEHPSVSGVSAHGTTCAGIALSIFNNSLGVAGVAGSCQIMPLALKNWTSAELAPGINFARINGAQVINMSLRMDALTPPTKGACG